MESYIEDCLSNISSLEEHYHSLLDIVDYDSSAKDRGIFLTSIFNGKKEEILLALDNIRRITESLRDEFLDAPLNLLSKNSGVSLDSINIFYNKNVSNNFQNYESTFLLMKDDELSTLRQLFSLRTLLHRFENEMALTVPFSLELMLRKEQKRGVLLFTQEEFCNAASAIKQRVNYLRLTANNINKYL